MFRVRDRDRARVRLRLRVKVRVHVAWRRSDLQRNVVYILR